MRFLKQRVNLKQDYIEDESSDLDVMSDYQKVEYVENGRSLDVKKEEPDAFDQHIIVKQLDEENHTASSTTEDILPCRGPRKNRTKANADSKNIVKNYGKALCAFASTKIALSSINSLIAKNSYGKIDIPKFMETMKLKKETTNSMESVRKLLMIEDGDSEIERAQKLLFKDLSVIFMKYFSVNWIYNGKLLHKEAHLKFRFKMLRRIQNPEYFTYLKSSTKN